MLRLLKKTTVQNKLFYSNLKNIDILNCERLAICQLLALDRGTILTAFYRAVTV